MQSKLRLHQEVLLLAVSDKLGTKIGALHTHSVASAMLAELILSGRATIDNESTKTLRLVDSNPNTDSALLNEVIDLIRAQENPAPVSHWQSKVASIPNFFNI